MKKLVEKNYYEILDLELGATEKEIDDAYERIKKHYSVCSIAAHSLFSQEEKGAIFEKATRAYEALTASKRRYLDDQKRDEGAQNLIRENENMLHGSQKSNPEIRWDYRQKDSEIKFRKPCIAIEEPKSLATEQYRFLCSRIEQSSEKNAHKVIAITSAIKGEGKTTTTINIAYVLAHEFKKKVLLIDGDLRNPSLPTFFEFKNNCGLVDVLAGRLDPSSALQTLYNSHLTCISASNSKVDNPSELLSSVNMKRLINSFKRQFDLVLIDCPPILPVVDMSILDEVVDAMIFVVRAGKTPRDLVLKALNTSFSSEIIGIVLNGAVISAKNYSYYYKY